jgi:hypothetical protein
MAAAFGGIAVPKHLRERILAGVSENFGGLPQAECDLDAAMIGAFASIHPPVSLRTELITVMQRTAKAKQSRQSISRYLPWSMAAAAGVALAFFLTRPADVPLHEELALLDPPGTVNVDVVQASFINTFESPLFSLDQKGEKHGQLMQVLEEKKLPCPKRLPPGLVGVKGVGCRELVIDGKRGSLVCFDEPDTGTVHLVNFNRQDVCGDLPARDHPAISQNGPWAVARWMDDGYVFVLLGSRPIEKLASLF